MCIRDSTYVRFNEVDNPAFFAFRTTDGNVGWFRVDDEGFQGTLTFSSGQVATDGESLVVGGNDLCGPAVDLLDGILTIEGADDTDDVIAVSTANGMVVAGVNGCEETYPVGSVKEIVIEGGDGADEITVNFRGGKTIRGGMATIRSLSLDLAREPISLVTTVTIRSSVAQVPT